MSEILSSSTTEQSFEGDVQVRMKIHLPKEIQRALGRAPAPEPAPKWTRLGVKATLTDREPRNHLPKESSRNNTGPDSARESASTRASTNSDASLGVKGALRDCFSLEHSV